MVRQLVPLEVLCEGDVVQASHYLSLEPVPRSAGAARRFVSSHARELPEETRDALLLTSELVTNAVLHARTVMEVGIFVGRESVVVGVHDLDLATPLQEPYAAREGGWGEGLVAVLADFWSTTRHPEGGKTVWFRLLRGDVQVVADGAAARADAGRRDG